MHILIYDKEFIYEQISSWMYGKHHHFDYTFCIVDDFIKWLCDNNAIKRS